MVCRQAGTAVFAGPPEHQMAKVQMTATVAAAAAAVECRLADLYSVPAAKMYVHGVCAVAMTAWPAVHALNDGTEVPQGSEDLLACARDFHPDIQHHQDEGACFATDCWGVPACIAAHVEATLAHSLLNAAVHGEGCAGHAAASGPAGACCQGLVVQTSDEGALHVEPSEMQMGSGVCHLLRCDPAGECESRIEQEASEQIYNHCKIPRRVLSH